MNGVTLMNSLQKKKVTKKKRNSSDTSFLYENRVTAFQIFLPPLIEGSGILGPGKLLAFS